jgi:hypothetical protein
MINNKNSNYYLVSICKDLNIHTIKILYKSFSINDIDFMINYFRYRLNTLYIINNKMYIGLIFYELLNYIEKSFDYILKLDENNIENK